MTTDRPFLDGAKRHTSPIFGLCRVVVPRQGLNLFSPATHLYAAPAGFPCIETGVGAGVGLCPMAAVLQRAGREARFDRSSLFGMRHMNQSHDKQEDGMRFGAGMIIGVIIGVIIVIWLVVQVFQGIF